MNVERLQYLLAMYEPHVQELALGARDLVLAIFPQADEQIDLPAKIIAFGHDRTYKGMVCAVALQRNYVNIMFSRGVDLPDPDGLLLGTGKRARHARINTAQDLQNPSLAELLRAAVHQK